MSNDVAIVFPSREALKHGLNREFYDCYPSVRALYKEMQEYVGIDFYQYSFCEEMPVEYAMPCLALYNYALYSILRGATMKRFHLFGFSQGEFAAVAAAGCLEIKDTLQLILSLEKLIVRYKNHMAGRMVRTVGLSNERIKEICNSHVSGVSVAVDIGNMQAIISGTEEAIGLFCEQVRAEGIHWIINISDVAFHSPLCKVMKEESDKVFDKYVFHNAQEPFYSCITGKGSRSARDIKTNLANQIYSPIQFNTIVDSLKEAGVTRMIELGPGCTVSGNARLIQPDARYQWIHSPSDLEHILEEMST